VLLLASFSYITSYRDLTNFALSRRQAIAYLAAATLKEKLDRLTDIGISLATRVRFRQLVGQGKWIEAVEILRTVPKDFPFIDRVFLTDPNGTLMTDFPPLPDVRGKNFAFRDWYQGVSNKWKPYVSEVYKRAAEPRINAVAIAVPIKTENQTVTGILVLQVGLNTLFEWTKNIEVGPSGFVYFVDRGGHVAAHPRVPPQGEIVDHSSVPAVQKALRGERGVEVLFNPIENEEGVSAYEPVPGYGWGVIAQQPKSTAFVARDSQLMRIFFAYGLICLFSAILAYLGLRTIITHKKAEEKIKKLNEDLERRAIELEASNKELEAFSYSVSHDLRAPLRATDGFSRILLEKHASELPPDAQRYLNLVRDNAQQMGHLIDDLLTFSRLSRQSLKRQRVAPVEIVRPMINELQREQAGRKIEISLADLPACEADPALLKQVFVNLLSNALKYTRQREVSKIDIDWQQTDGSPVYFVKDNGVGFDMQYVDKLFGVFQRLHRAEEYEGTGVGLAIVQRIIHRHGGRVWAHAEIDKGATFYFTLGGSSSHG
jgi:signal transduction histidine kinase